MRDPQSPQKALKKNIHLKVISTTHILLDNQIHQEERQSEKKAFFMSQSEKKDLSKKDLEEAKINDKVKEEEKIPSKP